MKMEWKDCRRLVISGLLLYLAVHYWSVLAGLAEICIGASAPLILGFMLAYMVNIPMTFFERKLKLEQRFPKLGSGVKPLYVLLTLVAVGSVLFLVGKLVVPELVRSVRLMYSFLSSPQAYPTNFPPAPITRWHGTIIISGLRLLAIPTAREAFGLPARAATSP